MSEPEAPGRAAWHSAQLAAAALATDPVGLGGINVHACPGPVRDTWLAMLRELLPAGTPWRRIPLHASEARLLGGIDLAATLRSGKPVAETGLLAEADGGIALLAMAERAARTTVAHLCFALDNGEMVLERDGLRGRFPARLAVVALDEGVDDEALAPPLIDRLAIAIDLHPVGIHDVDDPLFSAPHILKARQRLPDVSCTGEQLEALATVAVALGVDSPRALLLAVRLARALAALADRDAVGDSELGIATALALAHRATRIPDPGPADEQPEPEAPEPQDNDGDDAEPESSQLLPLDERLLEATAATIPAGLLSRLQSGQRLRPASNTQGKSGAWQRHRLRGRPAGTQPGDPRSGARLNLVATLRAAAPWQGLRRAGEASHAGDGDTARVVVQRDDFRVVRYRQRSESTTIFVVDASGSAALHRLAEAKGAVELLLADCYVRRDQVAMIAFRGEAAELVLPPTRSLVRAKRGLGALPGGGGTPLASAIEMTAALADQTRRAGGTPCYVMLTDGRANIARCGEQGREVAASDAVSSASLLRAQAVQGLVIDTSPRPARQARELAEALGAQYLPLPHADAEALRDAVQASAP